MFTAKLPDFVVNIFAGTFSSFHHILNDGTDVMLKSIVWCLFLSLARLTMAQLVTNFTCDYLWVVSSFFVSL